MSENKLYLYTSEAVMAVFEASESDLLAPEGVTQFTGTEDDALAFFSAQGISVPSYFLSLEKQDQLNAENNQQEFEIE